VVATELQPELMPAQRGWGFFVFVACAIVVIFIAAQRQDSPDEPAVAAASEPTTSEPSSLALTNSIVGAVERPRDSMASLTDSEPFARSDTLAPAAAETAMLSPTANPGIVTEPPAKRAPPAPLSEVSFESASIVTTESSIAAVFLVKRSQPLRGRARVQWIASSGTADAGIDFASSAAGSVEFADGQAQRAIYVPLRNDLLQEGDETFTVKLQSPQNARLGPTATAEATIRDDD
jgi:hypothetical protein